MALGKRFKLDVVDLGGGARVDLAPHQLRDNESARLVNFFPTGPRLSRRSGITQLTTSNDFSPGGIPLSISQLKTPSPASVLTNIVGAAEGFYKVDAGSLTPLPAADGTNPGTSTRDLWCMIPYLSSIYAMRKNGFGLKRVTGSYFVGAGITAPTGAASIADGGAGLIDIAGDYQLVYTFASSTTADESNPSPVSGTVTLATLHSLAVTHLETSTNPLVDVLRFYLTIANQQGEYFYVTLGDVPNGSGTATVSIAQDSLGRLADFDNELPPDDLLLGAVWQERLWATDGENVFRSGINRFGGWSGEEFTVAPDTANPIRGLISKPDYLMVGKTNEWWRFSGSGATLDLKRLPGVPGVIASFSVASGGPYDFWLTPARTIVRFDGSEAVDITTDRIRTLLTSALFTDQSCFEFAAAAIHPSKPWYMLTVNNFSVNNYGTLLVYNWVQNTWTVFQYNLNTLTFTDSSPISMSVVADEDGLPVLLAILNDYFVYQIEVEGEHTDNGDPILFQARSKGYSPEGQEFMRVLRHAGVNCSSLPGEEITVAVYKDAETSPINSTTVDLGRTGNRKWKRFPLSTMGTPGTNLQLGITGSIDSSSFDIDGISMQGVVLKRQPRSRAS